ncbi:MAG: hypothetical protein P1V81_12290 [Planctomycetota bacterium]|nr:hypothetical protein [Planctomycetota bacterium]
MSRTWLVVLALVGSLVIPGGAMASSVLAAAQAQGGTDGDEVVAPTEDPAPVESDAAGAKAAAEVAETQRAAPVGRPPFADPTPLESTEPVLSIVGSGAPEVLLCFRGPRPGLEELSWRLGIAAALGEQLEPGAGTVHVLVDTGVLEAGTEPLDAALEYLIEHPGIGAVGAVQERPELRLRVRPPLPHVAEAQPVVGRPGGGTSSAEVIRVGLGLELQELDPAQPTDGGAWVRNPDGGTWIWAPRTSPIEVDEREAWRQLHAEQLDAPPGGAQPFPAFDSSEAWPEAAVKVVGEQRTTLSGDPVRLPAELAASLHERLIAAARVTTDLVGQPEHLGGDLWQVDLALGAPALQPQIVDPNRTYPKARFSVPLSWSGTVEGAAFPSLARLAWRPAEAEHFELLPERGTGSGRYGFPSDDLPSGVTLRLVISAPGALAGGRALNIGLDAGRSGRADLLVRLGAGPSGE